LCFFAIDRPVRFGLCVAAVLGVNYYRAAQVEAVEASARSFFGILKVERYREGYNVLKFEGTDPDTGEHERYQLPYYFRFRKLSHGTTLHGMQASESGTYPVLDDLKLLGGLSPWQAYGAAAAMAAWNLREEPLTYNHRTGPVGAIFHRFRAVDPLGDVAM